jgi:hypothetical protein
MDALLDQDGIGLVLRYKGINAGCSFINARLRSSATPYQHRRCAGRTLLRGQSVRQFGLSATSICRDKFERRVVVCEQTSTLRDCRRSYLKEDDDMTTTMMMMQRRGPD